MNAVLYNFITHKKINGTLFYCFEYFCLLKKYNSDIKFVIFNCSFDDLNYIKSIFNDKYSFNEQFLDDIIVIQRYSDIIKLKLKNVLTLDVRTYETLYAFLQKSKIFAYANDSHQFLNKNLNHNFYGWYDFQTFNIKNRLKIYKEIHKTFNNKGNKILITSLCGDNIQIAKTLKLDLNNILIKQSSDHNFNMFSQINKIIYWHTGNLDRNNRSIIESVIHNIELEVYLNGFFKDSISERFNSVKNGNADEYFLDEHDILVQDFLNASK